MKKLDLSTPDHTQQNIAKIAEIFPNCVTEAAMEGADAGQTTHAIDWDALRQELCDHRVDGVQERYRLDWPGKRNAILEANTPISKTLRPARDESVDFDTTKNLYIEGDNLDALKLLQETYLGKVKMIYIDPPYNTGKDFIYKDNFRRSGEDELRESEQIDDDGNRLVSNTESNGRFHSDWLSMMYPRLKLARNLLREDGVIFISIDDNEVHNLRKMGDEIFGADNFVATFPWRSRTAKADVPNGVSSDFEWIVCFTRADYMAGKEVDRKYYSSDDLDERWRLQDLTKNTTREERPNSYFTLINPRNNEEFLPSEIRTWSITEETFKVHYNNNKIVFPGDYDFLNLKRPSFRVFESEDEAKALAKYGSKKAKMPISTLLPEKMVGRTQHGSMEHRELFEHPVFSYPKPSSLIKYIAMASTKSTDIILDFFSGSGTTAHAVMELNAEDGGNRQYIMVQLPEVCDEKSAAYKAGYSTIAEIGKERIRRAAKKIREDHAVTLKDRETQLDTGFRVLKVSDSNMADIYHRPDALAQADLLGDVANIKPDRSAEDLLFQVMLDWGIELTHEIERAEHEGVEYYRVAQNSLIACFSEGELSNSVITHLAEQQPLRAVFRDSSYLDDAMKLNIEQLFKHHSPTTNLRTL